MAKYKAIIKYDGSKFYGWAKQPAGIRTVQGELESLLKTKVTAAGRTDRYVHAKAQAISFDVKKRLNRKDIYKLSVLIHEQVDGVKIKRIERAYDDYNPRYDSIGKTYEYYVDTSEQLKEHPYVFKYGQKIDIKKVREASKLMVGKMNLASFTAKETYKTYVKTVENIKISKMGKIVKFTISGPGFMRFQVRNMVGALLAYDRGNYSYEQFKDLLDNPEKGKSHYKAPGSGLYLKKVEFPKK